MINPSQFLDLVSGRRRGVWPAALRGGLSLAAIPYSGVVRCRNWLYDAGIKRSCQVGAAVVSVGNLTTGGTGKTPMVAWIARWFQQRGARAAIVSRGYGAERGSANDEARELAQKLPDVPHIQNPDRVAAARVAISQHGSQVVVLDDAMQHRRIRRDLEIVLLDATQPFGFGRVLPRGTLREPLGGLRRADVVVLSRADAIEPAAREEIRLKAARYGPTAAFIEVAHAPGVLLSCDSSQQPLDTLRDRPVAALCGIGNPAGFRHTLDRCGYRVVDFREFPDHHRYGPTDIESLGAWADRLDVEAVLCTHKDLVKLRVERLGQRPLMAVTVEMAILVGQEALEPRLEKLLPDVDR